MHSTAYRGHATALWRACGCTPGPEGIFPWTYTREAVWWLQCLRKRQKQLRNERSAAAADERLPLLARKPAGLLGVSSEAFGDALAAYVRDNPDGLLRPQVTLSNVTVCRTSCCSGKDDNEGRVDPQRVPLPRCLCACWSWMLR